MSNSHKDIAVFSAAQKRALLAELLQARECQFFPVSFAQQQLWFLNQLQPSSSSYNIPIAIRLTGALNVAALQQTLNEIVRRHEVLRTTLKIVEDQPVQAIAPTLTLALNLVNLQEFPEVERHEEVLRLAKEEAQRPFNLTQAPLLRSTLLQLSDAEYVLLFTMHHIISDAWSIALLIREVAVLYTAFSTGKPSPLPELPIQYADFAVWQRQRLQNQELEAQLAYWQQQIGSNPPVLQLPTDRPRPVIQTFRGATRSFSLPTDLTTALKALSKKAGVTLFMTLLAAFKILLHRYTSQDDILVGSPIANRNRAETESLIGCFVNTLVLRTSLEGNPSFWDLLERVRECTLSAYAHQDLPFEYLVEKLQPERDLSHNPLFQVSFVLQNTPTDELQLPGLTINFLKSENQTAKFDLSLDISENQLGLAGLFEYNTDLFDATTVNRMVEHFCNLLSGIVANPQQSIWDLPLLSALEQRQLLGVWSGEGREAGSREQGAGGRGAGLDLCIHELFAAQVERTPDAIAVVFENQQLTYQELNQRANQLAHHLQTLGVAPEVLVGICVERSLDMVVGILGILKAGGAYVPLDPAYPQERLAFMLSDSQVSVLLTHSKLLTALPEHSAQVVCLDTDWEEKKASPPALPAPCSPANLAYVIYTSGSTGKPKGVLISHANVVRLLTATQSWFHFSEQDVWTLFHSYAFDFSVWELWGALLSGGRLVVVPYWISRSPEAFYSLLCQERVTVLNQTPSAFRQIIRTEDLGSEQNLSLRLVIFGGEALELQSLRPWFERHGDQVPQLVNMYGITETTVHVTYRPLAIADLSSTGSAIGRPLPDLQVYVLDRYLQPVPIGVPGEMYVGGAGLARGYLNRPDLTPERFIPNPYSNKPGARLYKSGDLVRYLLNGDIEYLGRIDQQVKIRGFRIELGEIEAVLSQYPAVQASVVTLREDEPENKRLVAYTVPQPEQLLTIDELRHFLKEKLPNYMMPSAFVILEALPLTPNGKIDYRALPAPETAISVAEAFVAPCTPVEEVIAGIWTQVLGLQIGTHDNFFELGGHSLLATQVISRLREAFQVELPLQCLFESPTVVSLAKRIETACRAKQGRSLPPIVPISRDRELPLSFAQQRLWFLEQLEPGAYNIPAALRLQGALNVEALTRSFNEVVKRHEALRTSFITVDGQPMQAIAPSLTLKLPLIDLTNCHPSQRQAEVQRLATEDALQPFNLTCCPLLKVTLVRLDAAEHIVLLTMHHIISDAWSMGVLLKEVAALYAVSTHQPSPLPELSIQYPDFAVWQRQWLQGELLQTQLNYWKQQLGSTSTQLALPTPSQRTVSNNQGASQSFVLSPELTRAITQMSRQAGVTLFMTLLAAFQASLYCFTGTSEIRVGSPIANRHSVEIEKLIGFFVNTLVLRIDLSGNPSFRELLVRSRQVTLAAYAHQDLPFEKLVEELQPERNLHNSLYQAWFVLHNAPMSSWELPGLTLTPFEINTTQTARHDLLLAIWESPEVIEGAFDYKTQLLDKAAVTRLIRYFETLLHHVTNHPNTRLNELAEILSHTDKEQQLIQKREIQTSTLEKLKKIERKPIGNL